MEEFLTTVMAEVGQGGGKLRDTPNERKSLGGGGVEGKQVELWWWLPVHPRMKSRRGNGVGNRWKRRKEGGKEERRDTSDREQEERRLSVSA